jgi:hypothetical protein
MKVMVIVEATQEPEAQARAVALDDRRQVAPARVFNYDVRPHSHLAAEGRRPRVRGRDRYRRLAAVQVLIRGDKVD